MLNNAHRQEINFGLKSDVMRNSIDILAQMAPLRLRALIKISLPGHVHAGETVYRQSETAFDGECGTTLDVTPTASKP